MIIMYQKKPKREAYLSMSLFMKEMQYKFKIIKLKKFRTLELSIFFVPFLSGYPVASYFGLAVGYFFLHVIIK